MITETYEAKNETKKRQIRIGQAEALGWKVVWARETLAVLEKVTTIYLM